MNKKGIVSIVLIMLGVVIVIFAIAVSPVIRVFTEDARNESSGDKTGLNCSSNLISDYDKATCLSLDLYNPLFIGILIGMVGIIFAARAFYG
jgi:flagellar basal body-associated protein FliL